MFKQKKTIIKQKTFNKLIQPTTFVPSNLNK